MSQFETFRDFRSLSAPKGLLHLPAGSESCDRQATPEAARPRKIAQVRNKYFTCTINCAEMHNFLCKFGRYLLSSIPLILLFFVVE